MAASLSGSMTAAKARRCRRPPLVRGRSCQILSGIVRHGPGVGRVQRQHATREHGDRNLSGEKLSDIVRHGPGVGRMQPVSMEACMIQQRFEQLGCSWTLGANAPPRLWSVCASHSTRMWITSPHMLRRVRSTLEVFAGMTVRCGADRIGLLITATLRPMPIRSQGSCHRQLKHIRNHTVSATCLSEQEWISLVNVLAFSRCVSFAHLCRLPKT